MSAFYLSKVAAAEPAGRPAQQTPAGKRGKPIKMAEDTHEMKDGPEGDTSRTQTPPPFSALYQQRQKCELRRLLKHTCPELKTLDGVVDEELAEVLSSDSGPAADDTGFEGEVRARRWIFENCPVSGSWEPQVPSTHTAEGGIQRDVRRISGLFEQPWENLQEERAKENMDEVYLAGVSAGEPVECEEMVRMDVQSARRMFERQSVDNSRGSPDDVPQSKCIVSEDERGAVQKRKQAFETCGKQKVQTEIKSNICFKDLKCTSQKQAPGVIANSPSPEHGISEIQTLQEEEEVFERKPGSLSPAVAGDETSETGSIHTSAALFANNPFIATNIAREHSHRPKVRIQNVTSDDIALESRAHDDMLMDNVKNRTQMFESMPFDRINQENKEEREAMMESIKDTLNSLYHFNAIHSHGSIIEVLETGNAKRAKYTLSHSGLEIDCDELAEGGLKNCIVHLLPRATLRPQVMYLKEDEQGYMEVTPVDVPAHQQASTANQDRDFRTINVVQLVEDILSQDSSLRKGVIIQEGVQGCVEVTVYSLYYHAEGEVKRYCLLPGQATETHVPESSAEHAGNEASVDVRKGDVRSTINSLMASARDHTRPASLRPQVDVKGNVKLFKSCIEKGDLEYLKTLQPSEEELSDQTGAVAGHSTEPCRQQAEEMEPDEPEWVPVDVKKLKSMFSSGGSAYQGKATHKHVTHDDTHTAFPANHSQSQTRTERESISERDVGFSMFSPGQESNQSLSEACDVQAPGKATFNLTLSQETLGCPQTQGDAIHQAELVEAVEDDENEISNLNAAIDSLQQATRKEKAICLVQNEQTCFDSVRKCSPSPSNIHSEHESVCSLRQEGAGYADTVLEGEQTSHACDGEGLEGTDVVQKGHLKAAVESLQRASTEDRQEVKEEVVGGNVQAALDSLGKSNFNVTKGDFRTAMISRNMSKCHMESSKKPKAKVGFLTESTSTPTGTVIEHNPVATEELSAATAGPPSPGQTTNNPAMCSTLKTQPQTDSVAPTPKRPMGPKPAIPPKPNHLNSSQVHTIDMLTKPKNHNESQPLSSEIQTQLKEENPPQALSITPLSYKDVLCKGLSQTTDCVVESQLSQVGTETQAGCSLDVKTKQPDVTQPTGDTASIHQVQSSQPSHITGYMCSFVNESDINLHEDKKATEESKSPLNLVDSGANEESIEFQKALQKFEAKKGDKKAPLKPKRVKIAQSVDQNRVTTGQMCDTQKTSEQHKVVMREKKVRSETEDERRQRLSVQMDEIMRGNVTTAMEIFDNLRKQEQLQTLLSKVEEIEEDTSQVDVKSLRSIFEDVPDWVVTPRVKKPPRKHTKQQKVKRSQPLKDDTESMSSMELVFGDLERASEEIMKLKDQTLARLVDIEEAIKKALYSVSTLKSDSDIASLSGLFKESLGTAQSYPITSNIRKISIGSSRATQAEVTESSNSGLSVISEAERVKTGLELPDKKPQSSPPSSPSFISIESAVRKEAGSSSPPQSLPTAGLTCQQSSKSGEKFRSTKTFECNRHTQNETQNPKEYAARREASCSPPNQERQVTVLEVQTMPEGNGIAGTERVQQNYETRQYGSRIYSAKTSAIVTAQPESTVLSRGPVVTSRPARNQVVSYPDITLPINKKP